MSIEELKNKDLLNACKEYKVKSLFAFGSVLRNDFNEHSDIDFVVDFDENDPIAYGELYFNFLEKLEGIYKREIDLQEQRALKNKYFKMELDKTKVKLYGY